VSKTNISTSKNKEIELYFYDKQLQQVFDLIKKDLSTEDHNLAKRYNITMVKDTLSKPTRLKNLKIFLNLGRLVNKKWSKVTKNDIDHLIVKIMDQYSNQGKETETSRDHKKILKMFHRWYKLGSRSFKEVGDPPETAGIRLKKPSEKIVRENLIDEQDISNLLCACGGNLRDRAFIHVHYEAATRPGEILSLKLKHVKFDENGAIISVDGKTGPRQIRLVLSFPDLRKWMDAHPMKEDLEAPLWITVETNHYGEPLSMKGATLLVQKRCKIAKISKRVNLQLFRHSGATNAAKYLKDELMKIRHGWSANSTMPAKYTHMINADLEEAIFKEFGLGNKKSNVPKTPKICHVCKNPNAWDSKTCSNCGKALDLKTAIQMEENEKSKTNELEKRLSDTERILRKIQERLDDPKN